MQVILAGRGLVQGSGLRSQAIEEAAGKSVDLMADRLSRKQAAQPIHGRNSDW